MGARILVVEDNPGNLELMTLLLESFGHVVLKATDGVTGIELARRECPDLILCDIHLPGKDGLTIARELLGDPSFNAPPLVAVTALAMRGDREKGLAAGFQGYIYKPIDPKAFTPQVEAFLPAILHGMPPVADAEVMPSAMDVEDHQQPAAAAKILVVDDRMINREFLSDLLGESGYAVIEAADGESALDLVLSQRPDLVITDVLMPKMGGIEFADRVRSQPAISSTPIIFYTATYKLSEIRKLADSCRVSAILAKPSEPRVILEAVGAALSNAPRGTPILARESQPVLSDRLREAAQKRGQRRGLAHLIGSEVKDLPTPTAEPPSHSLMLRLATLLELNLALSEQNDMQDMLQLFCRGAQDLIACKYVVIGILDGTGHRLERWAASGLENQVITQFASIDAAAGVFAKTIASPTPRRLRKETNEPTALGLPSFHPPIESLMLVPVPTRSSRNVSGWMYFADKAGRNSFDDEDEELATTLAAQIALAYGNLAQYEEIQLYAAKLEVEVAERRRAQDDLSQRITHDQVTGLPRFTLIEGSLKTGLADAASRGERVIVLYIDIDRFHVINELRGRSFGDLVLCAIGERLRVVVADRGWVSHVGGDEFLAAIVRANVEDNPLACAEAVRNALEVPIVHDGEYIYFTCSLGVSCFPDNGTSPYELMRQAESAMMRTKRERRNVISVFSNDEKRELADRIALGLRLKEAIRDSQLVVHYQPIISAQDWRVLGFEALVRWQHPDLGLLLPGQFLHVAEDLGLIVDIGRVVLSAACAQARSWLDTGARDFYISVNVSALQLYLPTFLDELRASLAERQVPSGHIQLELTENVLVENTERVLSAIRALKAIGTRVAIDDFGTGYSSLNYLRRFPIDKIKIDQSFVSNITSDASSASICRAIISLGHELGIDVLAEGVETVAQVAYLLRSDCDFFQGYHFGRPVAAEEAFDLLGRTLQADSTVFARNARTVLLVDDEENVLRALSRMLRPDGYRILTATGAAPAFELLAKNDVQVIVCDQRMPETSGTEFLSQVKQMYPDSVRIILSGYTDLEVITDAINRGAIYKFLTKPWSDDELRVQIRDAFRLVYRQLENREQK